jgi:hypothetical protein
VTWLKWMLVSVGLEIVLLLTQHRCTVCAEGTIGLEIMHPMELLGDVGHVESRFGPFGDSVSVGARLVHGMCLTYHSAEIILDAPDGTLGDVGHVNLVLICLETY